MTHEEMLNNLINKFGYEDNKVQAFAHMMEAWDHREDAWGFGYLMQIDFDLYSYYLRLMAVSVFEEE